MSNIESTSSAGPNSRSQDKDKSLIDFYSEVDASCGYCKPRRRDQAESNDNNSNIRPDYRMMAIRLTPNDYQDMLDRQWRRSGTHCYFPINSEACCPNYTIKCDATKFEFSRSKRKCVNKLNMFLLYGRYSVGPNIDYTRSPNVAPVIDECEDLEGFKDQSRWFKRTFDVLRLSTKSKDKRFVKHCERKAKLCGISPEECFEKVRTVALERCVSKCRQAEDLEKHLFPILFSSTSEQVQTKHQLEISLLPIDSDECKALRDDEFELIKKYQTSVHKEDDWTMEGFERFLIETPIINESIKISKDQNNESSIRGPEDSNLPLIKPPNLPTSYGSYHCIYKLDKELIAVGVLDVLPKCITTVYFFYDPKYSFLNLGIYSALIEISMVRQMLKQNSLLNSQGFRYYNLGFYVHECKKMHYKARFRPSFLLCSETFNYIPTKDCLIRLKDKKYSRFDPSTNDSNILWEKPKLELIYQIPISVEKLPNCKRLIDYIGWFRSNFNDSNLLNNIVNYYLIAYVKLVGPNLATKMIFKLDGIHKFLLDRLRPASSERKLVL